MDRRAFIAASAGGALVAGPVLAGAVPPGDGDVKARHIATYVTNLRDHGGHVPPEGARLALVRIRDRPFDPNSVAVLDPEGRQLGYLPAAHGRVLAPLLDAGLRFAPRVAASRTGHDPFLALELTLVGQAA
jgi:hypothetical protein